MSIHRGAEMCRACYRAHRSRHAWDTSTPEERRAEEQRVRRALEKWNAKPPVDVEVVRMLKEKGCW